MKTIQMTIDEQLLEQVDAATQAQGTTRSAFIREALQLALRHHALRLMERRHEEGYRVHPAAPGEFDVWQDEQVWSEP
jgi:metal-responsive CopG/Arc/MetJ family transcriptional regulator